MIALISECQHRVMEELACYKFLTTSQLLKLGVCRDRSTIYKAAKQAGQLIGKKQLGLIGRMQRAENVYYLTPKGVAYLLQEGQLEAAQIKQPKTGFLAYRDYFHRKATIDLHMAFRAWCKTQDHQVDFFDTYFDADKAKIPLPQGHLIADALSLIHSQEPQLLVFEVYMGHDLNRTLNQLRQHAEALALGDLVERFGLKRSYRVHCLFEKTTCLHGVLKRAFFAPELQAFQDYFLFKPLEALEEEGFGGAWVNLVGKVVRL